MSGVEVIRAASLDGLPHGFLGRKGGVSTGAYAGLNVGLGSDDDRGAIDENRRRAVAAVAPGAALVTWPDGARPKADAIVTDRPGLVLGILTADCTPVLLADREAGVIGAAHAGWKGALGGVVESAVAAMEAIGARRERIAAAIGPVIARKSYEVDEAFARRFAEADPENERFFTPGREGHHQFDIEAYVLARLAQAGVRFAEALGFDTYAEADRFYSYRRATHRGEPGYGRQISLIALPQD
jgi:YfiH family protein